MEGYGIMDRKSCYFCEYYIGDDDIGSCRRYPPAATIRKEYSGYGDDEGEYKPTFSYPKVGATQWCGERSHDMNKWNREKK
jgi:hypothetical protein